MTLSYKEQENKMRYIAFFRGINVGGKHSVKMADLKTLFAGLGFHDAETYIQSGNVIFSSDLEKSSLSVLIENAFQKRFGFQSTVALRSGAELTAILDVRPFSATEIGLATDENLDAEHFYVYLSDDLIDTEKVGKICAAYEGKDKLHVAEYEIYLLCRQSIRDSKLAVMLSKLPQIFTVRNLKTMNQIQSLI